MTVATPKLPNYNTQTGTEYPLAIDAQVSVVSRLAAAYAPHEEASPSALKVVVDAGALFVNGALVANAAQIVTHAAADPTQARYDRVVIDAITGVASIVTGTPGAGPSTVAIPTGKLPNALVRIEAGMTVVTNSAITDERAAPSSTTARVLVNRTTSQSLTSGVSTAIQFTAEQKDIVGMHDNITNNTMLIVTTGFTKAKLVGNISFASNVTGRRWLWMHKNGNFFNGGPSDSRMALTDGTGTRINISSPTLNVSPGDYFELMAQQTSGGSLSVDGSTETWFGMELFN